MARTPRRKRNGALLVGVAFALVTAGSVYAHWVESIAVNADVGMGSADIAITTANTDDDGTNNGWDGAGDDGGGTTYDHWGGTSSNDPTCYRAPNSQGGYATPRLTSDVAQCRVTSQGTGGTVSTARIQNAYPGYWCTIRQNLQVTGSIPMKVQALRVYACGPGVDCSSFPTNYVQLPYDSGTQTYSYDSGDADGDVEVVAQHTPGASCGYQYDPGATWGYRMAVTLEDDAEQNAEYWLRFEGEYVNWNEWSAGACTGYP